MPLKIPRDKILSENSHPLPPVLPARSDDLDLHGYFLNFRTKNSPAEAAAPIDFLSKGLLRTVLFL